MAHQHPLHPRSLYCCTFILSLYFVSSALAQSRDSNCRNPVPSCNPNTNYFPESERIEIQFASTTITDVTYSDTFVDIKSSGSNITHSLNYRIVRCGCPRPPDSSGRIVLFTNPSSLSVHESPALALLEALDPTLETLSFVTTVQFSFSQLLRDKVASSQVQEAKDEFGGTDFAALQNDSSLSASIIGSFQFESFRTSASGIPLLAIPDFLERSPLGRAELIKVMGVFLGAEERANSIFARIVRDYQDASRQAREAVRRPSVLINRPMIKVFGTTPDLSLPVDDIYVWNMPHREQYITTFLDDANADYIHERTVSEATLSLPFSTVIRDFKFARFHLNVAHSPADSNRDTLEEYMRDLIDPKNPDARAQEAIATLSAVRCDNVYHTENRVTSDGDSNDFLESGIIKPDEILKDFVTILHPTVDFGDRELFYMGHYAAQTNEFTSDCPFNDFAGPPPSSKIYVDNEFIVTEMNRFDIERAWESDIQPELKALDFDAEYDFLFEPEKRADEADDAAPTRFLVRALTDPGNEAQLKDNTLFREALERALDIDVGQLDADGSVIPFDGLSSGAIAAIVIGSVVGTALLVWCIFMHLQKQRGQNHEDQLSREQFWGPQSDLIGRDAEAQELSRDQVSGPFADKVGEGAEAQELPRDQFSGPLVDHSGPTDDTKDDLKYI